MNKRTSMFTGFWLKYKAWCKKHKVLNVVLICSVLFCMIGIESAWVKANKPEEVAYAEFMKDLKAGNIDTIYYDNSSEYMRYTLYNDETREMTKKEREDYKYDKDEWRMTLYPSGETFREDMLKYGVTLVVKSYDPVLSSVLAYAVSLFLPIYLMIMLFMRFMGNVNADKADTEVNVSVRFSDVIGHDEIIKDLQFIVDLMKDRKKLEKMKMKIPHGILFTGEPGTGKTLLAQAVAGESGVGFKSVNASSIIELFAGMGAKKVRAVFKEARKMNGCIIFIDEIDAIGRSRKGEMHNSESVQTLNALLQEMDGFATTDNVFVIAATNMADVLDAALLRSGRFDRQIVVAPPKDWKERKDIFDYYLKDVKHTIDIEAIAKESIGFTGADIATIVNSAKMIAMQQESDTISMDNIEEAIDTRIFKGSRTQREKDNEDRVLIAYHEAGHAVMTYLSRRPIARATIIGTTSGVGGFVKQGESSSQFARKSDVEKQIRICMAGRCAERIKFVDITTGAVNDISGDTEMLKAYVGQFGFSKSVGMLDLGLLQGAYGASPYVNSRVLGEMLDLTLRFESETEYILRNHFDLVEKLAQELLVRETLNSTAIEELLGDLPEGFDILHELSDMHKEVIETTATESLESVDMTA